MKIVIAGGTGLIGRYLVDRYLQMGKEVVIISRKPGKSSRFKTVLWSDNKGVKSALESSEMLINLAGKSVDCRYHRKNREIILSSRLETTQKLGSIIQQCKNPPSLWVNSSTATIYRHAEDRPMTEKEGDIGSGFSVDVATKWEQCFFGFNLKSTRQVALRTAIVLSNEGGALVPYSMLARFGLGGKQGNGKQRFSFVHIHDVFEAIQFIKDRSDLTGVFNLSAPESPTNATFMEMLRQQVNVPVGLPATKFMLEIAAFFHRTETELLLKSRWVYPERLTELSFRFRYPSLQLALNDLIPSTKNHVGKRAHIFHMK